MPKRRKRAPEFRLHGYHLTGSPRPVHATHAAFLCGDFAVNAPGRSQNRSVCARFVFLPRLILASLRDKSTRHRFLKLCPIEPFLHVFLCRPFSCL